MKKFSPEESKRFLTLLKKVCAVLGAGIAYLLFTELTGWGIPCVLFQTTGIYCPGCGISRMFKALARLDLTLAAQYNLLVLCLLPLILALFIKKAWHYIRSGNTETDLLEKVFYIIAFILCIIFFIARNSGLLPFPAA